MADRNEPVGARLRRLFSNREAQEYGAAVGEGMPLPEAPPAPGNRSMRQTLRGEVSPTPLSGRAGSRRGAVPESMGMESNFPPPMNSPRMGDPEGSDEVAAVLQGARGARVAAAARPNTRPRPRAARGSEMSADDLNAMVLDRLGKSYEGQRPPSGASADEARERINSRMSEGMKKGGPVKKMAKGGPVKASTKGMKPVYKMAGGGAARGDGCAARGKTKGRMI